MGNWRLVIVSVTPIAFVLVQGDDVCIPHVQFPFTFFSAQTKDFM